MEANTPVTPSSPDGTPIQDKVNAPARPKGPNASAIVAGLVAVILGGLIIANETTAWNVDWSALGPGAIVVVTPDHAEGPDHPAHVTDAQLIVGVSGYRRRRPGSVADPSAEVDPVGHSGGRQGCDREDDRQEGD